MDGRHPLIDFQPRLSINTLWDRHSLWLGIDGKTDMRKGPGRDSRKGITREPLQLWMTKKEVGLHLDVSGRTLNRLVEKGRVTRQSDGRKARYFIIAQVEVRSSLLTRQPTPVTIIKMESPVDQPLSERATYAGTLIELGNRLCAQAATADRKNGRAEHMRNEALEMGHRLADDRDRIESENRVLVMERDQLAEEYKRWIDERNRLTRRVRELEAELKKMGRFRTTSAGIFDEDLPSMVLTSPLRG
jgi:hypothetical protein